MGDVTRPGREVSSSLTAAKKALEHGDEDVALEALVTAHRLQPDARLAEAIGRLSARLEPHLPPLAGKLAEFHPTWMATAKKKRAIDLPRLLSSVRETTHRSGTAIVTALLERGRVLARWPADPRISALVIEHLRRPGYSSSSRSTLPFWTVLFELLRSQGDTEALEFLRGVRFARTFRSFSDGSRRIDWFQSQADSVVVDLEARLASPGRPPRKKSQAAISTAAKMVKRLGRTRPNAAVLERLAAKPAVPRKRPRKPKPLRASRSKSISEHLRAARTATGEAKQLAALLKAWQNAPIPELATLIEAVSDRAAARLVPIRGPNRASIQKSWLAIAKKRDPRDLPRLLSSITNTRGRSTDALARVEALANWQPDPRTGAGVLAQLEVPAFHSSSSKPFWKALVELVVAHGDQRVADPLEELAARYERILAIRYSDRKGPVTWFRRQLESASAQLREGPAIALSAADRRAIHGLVTRLGDIDEPHIARIISNLDDDEPRHVFADHLLERADPRGELIALQLAGRESDRAAELVRDYGHAWIGPLGPVVDQSLCRFERGFLDHVEIAGFEPDRLTFVLDDPVWATVRTIHLGPVTSRKFPVSSSMRSLEKVTVGSSRRRSITLTNR